MPGTYLGGGTLIGPGIRTEPPVAPPPDRSAEPAPITQAELLKALGHSKSKLKLKTKSAVLKELRAEGVLLETGLPNPDHPKVAAIIKGRKKLKSSI